MREKQVRVGIVGAAGYTGAELMRLLPAHPRFELACVTSDACSGQTVASMYSAFTGLSDLLFSSHNAPELESCDLVFLAVPHTGALALAPTLLEKGITVIDLSADYRLRDADLYESYYKVEHTSKDLLAKAVFGLPELFREDFDRAAEAHTRGEAVLVACAGCYPTATSLAAFPLMALRDTQSPVVVNAISGVTGAGKKATGRSHFCSANENLEAYALVTHRHLPEIEQILGAPDSVIFSPHLAPLSRGLYSTVAVPLAEEHSPAELHERFQEFFRDSPFVEVLPPGVFPRTDSVAGTNRAHIGLAYDKRTKTAVATCAIDNLCKGSSGQAIQCANLVFSFAEDEGLQAVALPV